MTTSISEAARERIRQEALRLGFDVCRFADVTEPWPAGERLAEFVEAGRHGEMAWMADTLERRSHPQAMWGDARSAIVVGMNYGPGGKDAPPQGELSAQLTEGVEAPGATASNPSTATRSPSPCGGGSGAAISVYAQGDDYHEVIKPRLKALARWLQAELGGELKVFVDTAPLMEKPLAERAGLGWQGKHTNLVSREFGSWLFLGSILTVLEIPPDPTETDHCGACRACLAACPTDAFPAPYQLDARRCISYLTIELKDPIPRDLRPALGQRIYGCDDCLAVCPWNKFAQEAREIRLKARDALRAPPLEALAALDDPAFRALFAKSPVKRIGRDRFVRNVLYAIGNSAREDLTPAAERLLDDPSALVRSAAVWALSRLMAPPSFAALRKVQAARETDADVQAEWAAVS
jgi:epoxyqueuosine reductase